MNIPTDWTFKNNRISAEFDKHVREQLPWYDLATGLVAHCARHYIPIGGTVYDIGASTGNIGNALRATLEARNAKLIAIDNSEEMRTRYAGPGEIVVCDALEYDFAQFDFAVAFLCIMFFPVADRVRWVHNLAKKIKPGGAMIVFDKCAPVAGYAATVMSRLALAGKKASGVPAEEIIDKELSLSGIQRPIDQFTTIPPGSCEVFRFGDFAGWLIEGPNV